MRLPSLVVSKHQIESPFFTCLCNSPSIMRGCPLSPTFKCVFWMSTVSCLEVVPSGMTMFTVTSPRVCSQVYLSVDPPFPEFGFYPLDSSSLFSSSAALASVAAASACVESMWAATPGLAFRAASCASIRAASSSVTSQVCDSSAAALLAASLAARSAAAFSFAAFFYFSIASYLATFCLKSSMCLVKY